MVVIGVGNRYRSDDGAGLEVARRLAELPGADGLNVHEEEGEPVALLDAWDGERVALLVDAVSSGAPAGTIHRVDASTEALPASLRGSTSTHAVSVAEAIELGRALGRLPERVIVYGIEGAEFSAGSELSGAVAAVIDELAARVLREAIGLEETAAAGEET
jgi:hydrogenase maturation protease